MNRRNLSQLGVFVLMAGLTGSSLCPSARAEWGSVRANNRSAGEFHNTQPRVQPQAPAHPREAAPAVHENRPAENRRQPEVHGREFVAPQREQIRREAREGRHFDFDEDRRHLYFWSDYYPGYVLSTLPPGYTSVYAEGNAYDYYDGVFYQPGSSGYVVVNPPLGAAVALPPPGAELISLGPNVYYYAGGAFYLQEPQGFVVVAPPPGATVSSLPAGAVPVTINGAVYYQAEGAYFMPVMENGTTVYTVAQP